MVAAVVLSADDESGFRKGKECLDGLVEIGVEVNQHVVFHFEEILQLDEVGHSEPVEVFVAEIVGTQLRKTIEGDCRVVNITDKLDLAAGILKFCKNLEDVFIGILVGDFTQYRYGFGVVEVNELHISLSFIVRNMFL